MSATTTDGIETTIYRSIAQQIRDGNCVLFLGPNAVSSKSADGKWMPLVAQCAKSLGQKLDLSGPEASSLAHVASTLRMKGALSDTLLIAAVQDYYRKMEQAELSPHLKALSDLPFKIIINASPDDFITRYYAQSLRDFRFDFYNFRKPSADPLYKFNESDSPLIYNLFGHYKKPESLVLTYNDQLNYVNKITGDQHESLPNSLLAAFNVPRFYLFLGFDFEDWTLKILCDELFRNARNQITPFAYARKDDPTADNSSLVFFQSEFKMEFPKADMDTFVQDLLKVYADLDGGTDVNTGEPQSTRANALILHNSATDDAACKTLINFLKPLRLRIRTLADAVGEGDVGAWVQKQIDESQIVIPLVSSDFFDDSNPSLPLLEDLAKRNNPPNKFLVMPIIIKAFSLDGTALGTLPTVRPLKNGGNYIGVYDDGHENQHFTTIIRNLDTYLNSIGS